MNDLFKVDKLDDITREHFGMACVAAMSEKEELRGLLGIPTSSEYTLWTDGGKAKVEIRNWSRMLSMLIVSKNGTWLTSDHIDGMEAEAVIDEAYRRFMAAKPYIEKDLEKSFSAGKLKEGTEGRWLENGVAYIQRMKEFAEEADAK